MGQPSSADLAARCAAIELLAVDVDGVLTDGVIVVDDRGVESKHFHVRDGLAYSLWHRAGKRSAILSGRWAEVVDRRAAELKIAHVAQGLAEKGEPLRALLAELGLEPAPGLLRGRRPGRPPRAPRGWPGGLSRGCRRRGPRFGSPRHHRRGRTGCGSRGRRGHSQVAGALARPLHSLHTASSMIRSDAGVVPGPDCREFGDVLIDP